MKDFLTTEATEFSGLSVEATKNLCVKNSVSSLDEIRNLCDLCG
jgi:hypothetical protein